VSNVLHVEARSRLNGIELDLSLSVEEGHCLAIAGPSGAGKTSLLRITAGLMAPDSGRVTCGESVWLDTTRDIDLAPDRRRCGYLFQEFALFPTMSALDNVAFPLRKLGRSERRNRALALLERFGMTERAQAHPRDLSGGERQRVALARALARRPHALLLDEPLSALDSRTRARAARELSELLSEVDVPTVLVTHDFLEAAQLGDRVGVIDGGRVIQEGTASELAARPRTAFVADFTGAVVLTGTGRPAGDVTVVDLDGGGTVVSTDRASGPVAATVYPWEIEVERTGAKHGGSARNRLDCEVLSITVVGNRVRLGLAAGQELVAEITQSSAETFALRVGARVTATWKAAATRLVSR
jgi:molybdate transport system ATP-binding protein